MSAFVPPNSDGHPTQAPNGNIGDMYSQIPYFPMIGPYFGTATNGYQFSHAASGFPNAFQNIPPNPNMMSFSAHPQIPQLPSEQNALAARFLQNNNFPIYNNPQKNEFLESTNSLTTLNNVPTNESKSTVSSTNDSIGSGDSSNSENHIPARTGTKRSIKMPKREFKSPQEELSYRVRRKKNNEAARMSRIRRQQRENELQKENDQLRKENSRLKHEIELWEHKYGQDGLHQRLNPILSEIQNQKQ